MGSIQLGFDDSQIAVAKKRAILTTMITIFTVILIYVLALRIILNRILITPLNDLNSRLKEIAGGAYDRRLEPVPQKDLNNIVSAANLMSDEIASRTQILVENERNYREVYNSTSDAIFIHDAEDGAIVDVNQAMLDMYGYDREEVMSLGIDDLSQGVSPFSLKEAIEFIDRALHRGPQLFEWQAKRKNGEVFSVEVALKRTQIGDFDVVLASVRDISERKELEDKLRHAHKMEAIGALAGGIAHDFNNLLTAIIGYTELAQLKTGKESEVTDSLQQVRKASERAKELVQQILTFSRKQEQKKDVLELNSIVSEIMQLLRSTIPSTVNIKQDLTSKSRIIGDSGQMHQLIMNLCTNGYQAMPEFSGTLSISLKDEVITPENRKSTDSPEPGRYVVLEVKDDGVGMDATVKNKIFEPYFFTKVPGKGTGLGLSTVYGVIQSHKGYVYVDSFPGKGTSFQVYLPVTEQLPKDKITSVGELSIPGDKKVMVVDDEDSIRNLMAEILLLGGYLVESFDNGLAAWNAVSENPASWDLLITDQTMPGLTGIELARKVLQVRPDIPIILCTGYSETINREDSRQLGIHSFLQKPITMNEMLAASARALQDTLR